MPATVEVIGVSKTFPAGPAVVPWRSRGEPVQALTGVDLTVAKSESVALLGPNGAGKTTLLKILCSVLLPDAGEVRILGYSVIREADRVRRLVGYVTSDERSLYWRLTARENLAFFSALAGGGRRQALREADRVLELVDLAPHAGRRVMNLSTGMRQRLGLARGLLGSPRLLLLDEPTRSLDPAATLHLEAELKRMTSTLDLTLLFVTHDLGQARRLAQRALVLRDGRLVSEARLDDPGMRTWRVRGAPEGAAFSSAPGVVLTDQGLGAELTGTAGDLADFLAAARAKGARVIDLEELPHRRLEGLLRSEP